MSIHRLVVIGSAALLVLTVPVAGAAAETEVGLPAWDPVDSPNTGSGRNSLAGSTALPTGEAWAVGGSKDGLGVSPLVVGFDGSSWSIEETPEVDGGDFGAELLAVDAIAVDDVWAVGGYNSTGDSLIFHWDGESWSDVPHPTPYTFQRLAGVSGTAPDDVWAVGYASVGGGAPRTHVLHWDGTVWSTVAAPPGAYDHLYAVDAIAEDDVWASGAGNSGNSLTLHWDGSSWTSVPNPGEEQLNGVSAVDADDVWAVGRSGLTMRWDGATWERVAIPPLGFVHLESVSAIAADDVWAVGSTLSAAIVLHWDGSTWTQVEAPPSVDDGRLHGVTGTGGADVLIVGTHDNETTALVGDVTGLRTQAVPDAGVGQNTLLGVHARAADDVWFVGSVDDDTLVQRWDGSTIDLVPSPNVRRRVNVLEDADGVAENDVWAVGHHDSEEQIGSRTLAMRWDGTSWEIVETPNRGRKSVPNELNAVAAIATDDVWAVGTRKSNRSLIQHWDGSTWSIVPNRCDTELSGIVAFATDDVWAIGGITSCHWNGRRWSPVPLGGGGLLSFSDLDGTSSTDLWAVGTLFFQCGEGLCQAGTVQHYDGTSWTPRQISSAPLRGVEALATDDVWAVGTAGRAVLSHYDGSSWSEVPQPDVNDGLPDLAAIEASGPDDLWASGREVAGSPEGASLVLNARADDAGAVIGDTNVGGATVSWFGPESGSVETDPTGYYQVGGLDVGTYTFVLTNPGCTPGSGTVKVKAGTTVARALEADC